MTEQELNHFKDCEAREWISRIQTKTKEIGKDKATTWWQAIVKDMTKRRGEAATHELRLRMYNIKKAKETK